MTIPVMTFVDGQGGNISINGVILQPTQYRLRKQFVNQNVTNTGSGGARQRVRVITDWGFEAHLFFDAANPPVGVSVTNGVYSWGGIEAAVDGQGKSGVPCIFQIGATQTIYQGTALIAMNNPGLQAEGVVDITISGEAARGPLVGPIAGSIT